MRRALLAVTTVFMACVGSTLEQSRALFNAGRYDEAKARLETVDGNAYRALDPRTRATYALYRGLTAGALGDLATAKAWLGLAKHLGAGHPPVLDPDDEVRLKLAEQQYGALPSTPEPPPGP